MLKHATGDVLGMAESGHFDVVIHGCNCFNAMGGGIARTIAERYPMSQQVDSLTRRGDYDKLGNYTMEYNSTDTQAEHRFVIVNAYTQYTTSRNDDVFEYASFEVILQKMVHKFGDKRIGLPYIGMGLAGGEPAIIMAQIENFADLVAVKGGTVTLVKFG